MVRRAKQVLRDPCDVAPRVVRLDPAERSDDPNQRNLGEVVRDVARQAAGKVAE
jgi:hypothetical protein